jgi:hypothetical protein
MLRQIFDFVSSLKLTIICLAAALVLVFFGTIAQVYMSGHQAQESFFQSIFVWWPAGPHGKFPVFPGGHLLGGVLLINLITAHLRRFRWTWSKFGIHLTHIGLIVMLAGGLFTDLFAIESYMTLAPGETKDYSEDSRKVELAVIDESDPELDQVTAIPQGLLLRGGTIEHGSLPFRIIVRHFYQNSRVQMLDKAGPNAVPAATQGVGSRVALLELPPATAEDDIDSPSLVVEIVPIPTGSAVTADSLGSWLISGQLGAPQTFAYAGKTWRLELRLARYYKPYSLTLQKITHETYTGTDKAKNYASRVTLVDPRRNENRDVLIYMNYPLRYSGETYYQNSLGKGDTTTTLQVVHNPTFVAPYVACVIVGAGLLIQFAFHFAGFTRRRKTATAS